MRILKFYKISIIIILVGNILNCSNKKNDFKENSKKIKPANIERYNNSKQTIELIEQPCISNDFRECDCIIQKFNIDSNIFFIEYSNSTPYKFEKYSHCFKLNLFIYGHKISMDSIYFHSIKNQEILYLPGYVEGTLDNDTSQINCSLTFINGGINTSKSTEHTYYLKYNKITNTTPEVYIKFESDW